MYQYRTAGSDSGVEITAVGDTQRMKATQRLRMLWCSIEEPGGQTSSESYESKHPPPRTGLVSPSMYEPRHGLIPPLSPARLGVIACTLHRGRWIRKEVTLVWTALGSYLFRRALPKVSCRLQT